MTRAYTPAREQADRNRRVLTDEQAEEIVMLRFFEHLTWKEIALRFDVPVMTAHNAYWRAWSSPAMWERWENTPAP